MLDLKVIGREFKITDPDFQNCVGTIEDAWYELPTRLCIYVKGVGFCGTFFIDEGEVL